DVLPGELDWRQVGGDFDVRWNGQLNQLYFIEESTDLRRWSAAGVFEGADVMLTFRSTPDPATGARPPAQFYRVRSMEVIPPLEETSTAP
ncbi:MAG TPA: hypothetical protein VLD18_05415, partial [Verrucomicrobiae bacterium]|nr:hypothetical protein [Verrucomicrobiae bacterium]